jgi:ABC-type multidrug transport system fused ATPase/permease subunit
MKMRMVLAVAVALMVACSWLVPLESVANQQVDAGLKRALISFATARALNAVISVVQGTEVAVQPAGVGINFAPGQILDPVNDLVEQFGQLMLVASVAFGVEKVLINMGAHWAISSLLTVTAIAWVYAYLRRCTSPPWLTRMLLILLMTRFAMPLAIIGSDQLFREFLAADYQSSQQVIEAASGQINKLNTTVAPVTEDQSMVEKITGWVSRNADIKPHLESLKQTVEQTTERIIRLMVIFLLQTLVLPVLLLWVLWGIVRGTFETAPQASRLMK